MEATAGQWRSLRLPMPALRSEITASVWSPAGAEGRLLVAHDGPDYDKLGGLTDFLAASIAAGKIPPCHLALLPAGERFEWYSASPAYAKSLAVDLLPRLRAALKAEGPVIGAGVSLGALAMLHAQRRHPKAFAGLFLQSGSYFQPDLDPQESGFARWLRIVRFVGKVRRASSGPAVPAVLTCGADEENLANNRAMAGYLHDQGYPVTFAEVPGAHTWTSWRDAFEPHLTQVVHQVF